MNKEIVANNPFTWCFACGKDNEHGLHLTFEVLEDKVTTSFTPGPEHQSYPGRVHGGLVAVLLDEVTGNFLLAKDEKPAYTAKMEIRYRAPLIIGEEVIVEGWENWRRGRMVEMLGKITRKDGTVLAESVSKMMLEK